MISNGDFNSPDYRVPNDQRIKNWKWHRSGISWYEVLESAWCSEENSEHLPGYLVTGPVFQPRTSSMRSREIFLSNTETQTCCLGRFYVARSACCILSKYQAIRWHVCVKSAVHNRTILHCRRVLIIDRYGYSNSCSVSAWFHIFASIDSSFIAIKLQPNTFFMQQPVCFLGSTKHNLRKLNTTFRRFLTPSGPTISAVKTVWLE
jgi:hypothetical protein